MKTLIPILSFYKYTDDWWWKREQGLLLHQTDRHTQNFICGKNSLSKISLCLFPWAIFERQQWKIEDQEKLLHGNSSSKDQVRCIRKVMMKSGSGALWRFRRSGQLDFNYPTTLQKTHIPHAHQSVFDVVFLVKLALIIFMRKFRHWAGRHKSRVRCLMSHKGPKGCSSSRKYMKIAARSFSAEVLKRRKLLAAAGSPFCFSFPTLP